MHRAPMHTSVRDLDGSPFVPPTTDSAAEQAQVANPPRKDHNATLIAPENDPRLKPLLTLIDRRAIDVLSLDFFDTVWVRSVGTPTDVFFHLAARLQGAGLLPEELSAATFVEVRRAAERRARKQLRDQSDTEECTLEEIYDQFPPQLLPAADRARAAALELEVESALGTVEPAVVALAQRAKAAGLRVAIVSDTYFAGAHLKRLLELARAELATDFVLTSSEHRVNKGGGLFEELLDECGAVGGRIAHLGDHPEADVAGARNTGLLAFPLSSPPDLDEVLRLEAATFERGADAHGWTWLRRRAASRSVSALPTDLVPYFRLGASVAGPVLTGFADWVVAQATAAGCTHAACFMREGEFLAELIARAAWHREVPLVAKPLWISRQAAFRASLTAVDEDVLTSALERRRPPTIAAYCAALGLSPEEVGVDPESLHLRLNDPELVRPLFRRLLSEPTRSRIAAVAHEQRTLLLEHLAQVAPGNGPVALVDLGWGASIQRSLTSVLAAAGVRRRSTGLYLATTPRAAEAILAGSEVRGYLSNPGEHPRLAELVARSPEALEQLCLSAVGSVLGYRRNAQGGVEPVLEQRGEDAFGEASRAAVRQGILSFQQHWYAFAPAKGGEQLAGAARQILARLLARPTANEAFLLGRWRHDDNFGSADAGLIAPASRPGVRARTPEELHADPWTYWPAATAIQQGRELADKVAGHALLGLFGKVPEPALKGEVPVPDLPLRYRAVDTVNTFIKRQLPSVHAAAKNLALGRSSAAVLDGEQAHAAPSTADSPSTGVARFKGLLRR